MEVLTLWLFDTDADRLFVKDIPFSDNKIRELLCVDTEDIYSYTIPLTGGRGTFYVLYSPAHCRAENKLLYSFLHLAEINWSECIYGNAILLYAKNTSTDYVSLPFSDASEGVPFIKAHKNIYELPHFAVQSDFTKNENTQVTYPGISETTVMLQSEYRTTIAFAQTTTSGPNIFLLKMALKGLIGEGTICPISLEPLSQFSTVWMFSCGHACSPQSVQLNQCPTCRSKHTYSVISI